MVIKIEAKADFKRLDGLNYRDMAVSVMEFAQGYEIRIYRNRKTLAVFEASRMTQEDLTAIIQYIKQILHVAIVYSDDFYKSLAVN